MRIGSMAASTNTMPIIYYSYTPLVPTSSVARGHTEKMAFAHYARREPGKARQETKSASHALQGLVILKRGPRIRNFDCCEYLERIMLILEVRIDTSDLSIWNVE